MDLFEMVRQPLAFEWDEGNIKKNWERHRVSTSECEDVFFNDPTVGCDDWHSQTENRYYAYGETDQQRLLFVIFTVRKEKIRVISARDMNKNERKAFHEKIKKNPDLQ